MAGAAVETVDVSQMLSSLLESVEDLRVYWYVSDTVRPPAAVIGQPDIDFADSQSGFCAATWLFPVTVVTSRANDRGAQVEMSRLLFDMVSALKADVEGVHSIEPLDARPIPITVSGQDLPGYLLNIRIRA